MQKVQQFLITALVFLFPLFFLNFTQEFFLTNKFYLLGFLVLLLLLTLVAQFTMTRKVVWGKTPLDAPLLAFVIFYALSLLISSPNKIQALLNPTTGFATVLFFALFYYTATQLNFKLSTLNILNWSAMLVGLIAIIYFFNPFARINLPSGLAFLKNPNFTPTGSPIDLLLFLGFFTILHVVRMLGGKNAMGVEMDRDPDSAQRTRALAGGKSRQALLHFLTSVLIILAFALSIYNLFKPFTPNAARQSGVGPNSIFQTLPPFSVSWYTAVETLKNPQTALFGIGPDNFASIYTRVKTPQYNVSRLWNVNFTQSRSFILQLWTEIGIFGLLSFILIVLTAWKMKGLNNWLLGYTVLGLFFFPPSLSLLFLFFIVLVEKSKAWALNHEVKPVKLSFENLVIPYAGFILIALALILGSGYFLGRSYVAEYYYKKAVDGFAKNNAKQVYDNMRQAILINPYVERYRINFSQVNYLIANNLASKAQPVKEGEKPKEISAQDRQTIGQAIQASVNEAKAAVALNPNKAASYENIAIVYRNLLNAVQDADRWTIASFDRAIVMDPQNPIYRLNLGGVYYSLKQYNQAVNLFEQSVRLKPDWPNAYYNLAWASYQRQDFVRAAASMENVLKLLEKNKDSEDYKKAQRELEEFKKKIPVQESTGSGELKLQQTPTNQLPKLNLPASASPEAK